MASGIVLEFKFTDDPVPVLNGAEYIKKLDGEVPSWDEALEAAIALLRHAELRAFFATGRTSITGQRLHAIADALAGVSRPQWYADLAMPAEKGAEVVVDWRECHPEAVPCCARLENARSWASGGC